MKNTSRRGYFSQGDTPVILLPFTIYISILLGLKHFKSISLGILFGYVYFVIKILLGFLYAD